MHSLLFGTRWRQSPSHSSCVTPDQTALQRNLMSYLILTEGFNFRKFCPC